MVDGVKCYMCGNKAYWNDRGKDKKNTYNKYCSKCAKKSPEYRENYKRAMMEKYGVDVCFSGHMHGYERGDLNGVYYCVTGGGSGLDIPEPLVREWPHMTVADTMILMRASPVGSSTNM